MSSDTRKPGYVYRRAGLTADALRSLVEEYVLSDGGAFAFAASSVKLKNIHPCSTIDDVPLEGKRTHNDIPVPLTFGHVFSPRAEVRWKRRGEQYDALVLSEKPVGVLEPFALAVAGELTLREPKKGTAIILNTPAGKLDYKEYVAPNGAVQFVRYVSISQYSEGRKPDEQS